MLGHGCNYGCNYASLQQRVRLVQLCRVSMLGHGYNYASLQQRARYGDMARLQ